MTFKWKELNNFMQDISDIRTQMYNCIQISKTDEDVTCKLSIDDVRKLYSICNTIMGIMDTLDFEL